MKPKWWLLDPPSDPVVAGIQSVTEMYRDEQRRIAAEQDEYDRLAQLTRVTCLGCWHEFGSMVAWRDHQAQADALDVWCGSLVREQRDAMSPALEDVARHRLEPVA